MSNASVNMFGFGNYIEPKDGAGGRSASLMPTGQYLDRLQVLSLLDSKRSPPAPLPRRRRRCRC